jgi:peptidoglycan hydrolase-like protein with peptidoglycan-binding domain
VNFISGGGEQPLRVNPGYYRRFNYPNDYKNTSGIYIKKFERDYSTAGEKSITYQLINAFPKSMASIPVAYGDADLLKVSVTFNYDYYIVNREEALEPTSPVS